MVAPLLVGGALRVGARLVGMAPRAAFGAVRVARAAVRRRQQGKRRRRGLRSLLTRRGRKRWRRRLVTLAVLLFLLGPPLMFDDLAEQQQAALAQAQALAVPTSAGVLPEQLLPQVAEATGIPLEALRAYNSAAGRWEVDWAILAGIGKVECDHGRNRDAGCNPRGTVNHAGARGPMQFLGSTWRSSAGTHDRDVAGPPIPEGRSGGYATDGDGDGVADPWTWADATHAAARLLKANGVEDDPRRAVLSYNHSDDYVGWVMGHADDYRSAAAPLVGAAGLAPPGGVRALGGTRRYTESQITPTMQRVLDAIVPTFGRGRGVGCFRASDPKGEHDEGRSCDFMMANGTRPTPEYRQHGEQLAHWLQQNARALGVQYVIWEQHIWNIDRADEGWRPMEDRGSLTQNHFDHVHVTVRS
jgi:hypothetical protein